MMQPFDDDYATHSEVREMIDAAIRRHIGMLPLFLCALVGLFLLYLLRDF